MQFRSGFYETTWASYGTAQGPSHVTRRRVVSSAPRRMRDAKVRRLLVVNDMGHAPRKPEPDLVGAISIEDLVLVAQNARARDDATSVVGFHAVGCVERRGRGLGSLSSFRDGVDPSGCSAGPDRRRRCEIHDCLGAGASEGPSSFIPTFGGITGTDPRYGNRSRRRTFLAFSTVIVR